MHALAHRMVDDAITYLETFAERPAWQPVPVEVAARFEEPAPYEPSDPVTVYDEFLEKIFPYPMGNIHPRFWGWYMGKRHAIWSAGRYRLRVGIASSTAVRG